MSIITLYFECSTYFFCSEIRPACQLIKYIYIRRSIRFKETVNNTWEVYGEGAVKVRMCPMWLEKFWSGNFGLADAPCFGRLKAMAEE